MTDFTRQLNVKEFNSGYLPGVQWFRHGLGVDRGPVTGVRVLRLDRGPTLLWEERGVPQRERRRGHLPGPP